MYMGNFNRLYGTHLSLVFRIEKKKSSFLFNFYQLGRILEDDVYTIKKLSLLFFFSNGYDVHLV